MTELATFASAFAPDRSDAAEVVKVAGTLAEWAKQGVSHDDLRGRMSAMRLSTLGEGDRGVHRAGEGLLRVHVNSSAFLVEGNELVKDLRTVAIAWARAAQAVPAYSPSVIWAPRTPNGLFRFTDEVATADAAHSALFTPTPLPLKTP